MPRNNPGAAEAKITRDKFRRMEWDPSVLQRKTMTDYLAAALRTAIYVNPWVAALPGVMIFAVSICFNLLSDGMRSAMDIRS